MGPLLTGPNHWGCPLKGTLGTRPPYEEPRSPLHPGSPNQGPQDSVILAYAWVVPSGLVGDRQSPPVILGEPPVPIQRSVPTSRPQHRRVLDRGFPNPEALPWRIGRPEGLQQPLLPNRTDLHRWVGHQTHQEIFAGQISWWIRPGNTTPL